MDFPCRLEETSGDLSFFLLALGFRDLRTGDVYPSQLGVITFTGEPKTSLPSLPSPIVGVINLNSRCLRAIVSRPAQC